MKYYLGMDIGGTKCAVVLGEKGSSSVKDKIRFDTRSKRGWRTVVGELSPRRMSCSGETGYPARMSLPAVSAAEAL